LEIMLFSRPTVIGLGIVAAILVSVGSVLKARQSTGKSRGASVLIAVGYLFFALSVIAFIVAGFLNA
jgi:hypothetical protein